MSCPREVPFWGTPRLLQEEGDSHPGALAVYSNPSMRHALVSGAGAVSPKSGERQDLISSTCCKAGSSDSPHVLIKSQGLGQVEVNRDLACMAAQLHGIPRMVKSSPQSLQCGRGKLAPSHSRMDPVFEMAPSGSVL